MGLDIGFCKMSYKDFEKQNVYKFDDINYINLCGWRLKNLAEEIGCLGIKKEEYEYMIKVSDLAFFKTLWDKIKDNSLMMMLKTIEEIDEGFAYETYDSFSPIVKASLALIFNTKDFLDKEDAKLVEKRFIVHTLWELFEENMDLCLIEEMARAYQKMIEDKQDYVYFYISF
jgi:hypothetical protein